jgi:pyridoxine 4-dehydrogenase
METQNQTTTHITIGGNTDTPLTVYRMGYGTMRLTGPEIWGEPADRDQSIRILKRCVEKGVNYIDTADYYGPYVTNRLIAEALYPYPDGLVIGTKIGALREADKSWKPYAKPADLRKAVEDNLIHLKLERLDVVHFRMTSDHNPVPFKESMEAMFKMQEEGKMLHIGLSNVSPEELSWSLAQGKIATVQNIYSYNTRTSFKGPIGETKGGEEVLKMCEDNEIPLIPFFSLITTLPRKEDKIAQVAEKHRATKAQINLAWLLHKSRWMLPIPGTSSLSHLEENLDAVKIRLDEDDLQLLK